jgi:hypothetical protein
VTIEKRVSLMLAYYGAVMFAIGWYLGRAIGFIERWIRGPS